MRGVSARWSSSSSRRGGCGEEHYKLEKAASRLRRTEGGKGDHLVCSREWAVAPSAHSRAAGGLGRYCSSSGKAVYLSVSLSVVVGGDGGGPGLIQFFVTASSFFNLACAFLGLVGKLEIFFTVQIITDDDASRKN